MTITINGNGPVDGINSINGGPLSVRNAVINGNFGINQRAVSGTVTLAAGVYGHDRFKAGSGGCTYTFATALNVTTLTITAGTLVQVIEGLNLTSGTYTLSWTGTATARIDAGAYSGSGVTGTAVGGTNQSIEFATGTVSKVQYEFGSVATPFEHRPIGMELALCQRYLPVWKTSAAYGHFAIGQAYDATATSTLLKAPVTTRVPITGITTSGTFQPLSAALGGTTNGSLAFSSGTNEGCTVNVTGALGLSAGHASILTSGDGGASTIFGTGCEL